MHLLPQLGDEVQPLGDQELPSQGLGEIAFVPKELAHQTFRELRNRMPIIDIARSQAECQDLALIIDDQVQLKAEEPAHRGLAACGTSGKDAVLVNARIAADRERGGVDEADARAAAQLRVQIGHQRNQDGRHQLHEARIADQRGKLAAQVTVNVLGVIGFECPVMGLLKKDEDGHDFAGIHLGRAQALSLSR